MLQQQPLEQYTAVRNSNLAGTNIFFIPAIKTVLLSNNNTEYVYWIQLGIFSFLACLHSAYYSELYSDCTTDVD